MKNRNIQMKKRNDTGSWDNLFPVTLSTNVFNSNGKSVSESVDDLVQEVEQIGTTTITRTTDLLVSEIEMPSKNILFNRDSEGSVSSIEEVYNEKTIETAFERNNEGVIQQIDREML